MPGTPLPATASAVSASTPKMLLIQAEANRSSAARCNSSRSTVIGLGPDGSRSDTPILMVRPPMPEPAEPSHSAGPHSAGPAARSARLPLTGGRTRVRHRHLGGQRRVVRDEQAVDLDAA